MPKKCHCGVATTEKRINVERNILGKRIAFNNVPVSVCPNCSEQYISAKVVKQMDQLLAKNPEAREIDFKSDPSEQWIRDVLILAQQSNLISGTHGMDMPASRFDIYMALDRLVELRNDQKCF